MKETTKTSRTAGYLEKLFRKLNARFFPDEEIAEPIITVQNTPEAYGHVSVAEIWKVKGETKHELNIGAGTLDRPIENICATMLHEMVHLYNMEHGVKDTSRGDSYHNKRFRDEAERRGLHIEHNDKYGWTITTPNDELLEWILTENLTEIDMNRGNSFGIPTMGTRAGENQGGKIDNPPKTKKPSSTRKLQCPKCGCSCRATKAIHIMCMDCMEQMVEV